MNPAQLKRTQIRPNRRSKPSAELRKTKTGIRGFDELTFGGVPSGRTTLVYGGPGCGKTLFGLEFLVRGVAEFGEPGACLTFEETPGELAANVATMGFRLDDMIAAKKLAIDHIYIDRSQTEETGEYDLEGLFLRLAQAVDSVKAKRVLLDGPEALFSSLSDQAILRAELRRLFRWLKARKLTAIVTAEGDNGRTRHGIEEYISDCVVMLDNRVNDAVATRRLRVTKYRGSTHGSNEYPFLIDNEGLSVLPITSLELNQDAPSERVSTGIPDLDAMFGGKGYFRGSSVLISGSPGAGKTSLTCHFVDACCSRGDRCLFFSFEESPRQIMRNMQSIGLNLEKWAKKDLLRFDAARPSTFGLEMHLVRIHKLVSDHRPSVVVVDPVTALLSAGGTSETRSMLLRLVDFLKGKRITALLTALTSIATPVEQTEIEISSVVDTWILLRNLERKNVRNRSLYVLKARGLAHSNRVHRYVINDRGIRLQEEETASAHAGGQSI